MIEFIDTFFYSLSESQSITTPHYKWLPKTRSILILSLSDLIRFCTTYIVSRRTHRKHIRCQAIDICEPHRKHLFCCQECLFIGPLPSNRPTCHNIIVPSNPSSHKWFFFSNSRLKFCYAFLSCWDWSSSLWNFIQFSSLSQRLVRPHYRCWPCYSYDHCVGIRVAVIRGHPPVISWRRQFFWHGVVCVTSERERSPPLTSPVLSYTLLITLLLLLLMCFRISDTFQTLVPII
jgi:hypothetical protein